jgi:glycosyltransferase involved in cell wall biosynthesis
MKALEPPTSEPQPARIAFVITSVSLGGGAEMMLYKLLSCIDRTRFEPHVYCLVGAGQNGEKFSEIAVPVMGADDATGIARVFSWIRILRHLRSTRYEVIQGWMYHGNMVATLATLFRRPRAALVWNVRASLDNPALFRAFTRFIIRVSARLSHLPQRILFNSRRARTQHEDLAGYQGRSAEVIPNGFDCDQFAPDLELRRSMRAEIGASEDVIVIGLVARFHPMKDQATFLAAAASLRRSFTSTLFVMAGPGIHPENGELMKLIDENGLRECTMLLGTRRDIHRLDNGLDIATCCSNALEGFPNTVGEAMACGVPCVVTDIGDCSEIVGDTGVVIPCRDPERLAAAWKALIEIGADGRNDLGRRARERIVENYSIEQVARRYERLYSELAAAD